MSAPTIESSKRPKGQQRPIVTALRLTEAEHVALVASATQTGQNVAQYLRGLVVEATSSRR